MTDQPSRPPAVTYASRILYAYAALGVLNLPVVMAVFGLGYLVLGGLGVGLIVAVAYFLGEGRNWARILVWLFAFGVVVNIPSLVVLPTDGFFARRPEWYEPVDLTFLILGGALLLTAAVLLLRPSTRPFFRKVPVT